MTGRANREAKSDWLNIRRAIGYVRRLWPFVRPQRLQVGLVVLGAILYAVGYGARLLVIRPIVEAAADPEKGMGGDVGEILANVLPWSAILFFGAIAMAVGTYLKQYYNGYLRSYTAIALRRALVGRLLVQPMSFFNKERSGALMTRVTANTNGASQLVQLVMDNAIAHPLTMLLVLAAMVYTSPALTLLTLVILPLVMFPVVIFAGKIRIATKKKFKRMEESGNFFFQMLAGIRVVKSFRMEDAQKQEFERVSEEVFRRERKVASYKGRARFGVELTYNSLMAVSLLGLGLLISTQWFAEVGGLGTFIQFFAGLVLLYDPARRLGHSLNNVQESTAALDLVFELYDRQPEIFDREGAATAADRFEVIEFDRVGFGYDPDRPVLTDISFSVKRGEIIALVGQSGTGKSTLLDLIPRFYDVTGGAIRVDGVDLRDLKSASWLRQIAIVSQETFLFNTTIRENILTGRPEATDTEIVDAAKAANIYDEICAMPDKFNTGLGDRGVNLSGGQRQRLAIARAFLRKAPILILDEATSSLDTDSEHRVQEALDKLVEGCTVFVVAHRLSTVRKADMILVMDGGRIVERGNHAELMALEGRYAQAIALQNAEPSEPAPHDPALAREGTDGV